VCAGLTGIAFGSALGRPHGQLERRHTAAASCPSSTWRAASTSHGLHLYSCHRFARKSYGGKEDLQLGGAAARLTSHRRAARSNISTRFYGGDFVAEETAEKESSPSPGVFVFFNLLCGPTCLWLKESTLSPCLRGVLSPKKIDSRLELPLD